MGKFLFALVLIAVAVGAMGVYLDWFHFSAHDAKDAGKAEVGVTVDKDKIKADVEKGKEKAKGLESQAKEKIEGAKAAEKAPPK